MSKSKKEYGAQAWKNLGGRTGETVDFLLKEQFLQAPLWQKFVDQFRQMPDGFNQGWRGEYWGKSMRGAVMIYQATQNETLYSTLETTVKDLLTVAGKDGRVSSYAPDTELRYWDIWCRKYVLLGLEYFLEICRDEDLRKRILSFLKGCADYILARVGAEEGKISVTASGKWQGLNASSVLEPMMRLYRLTNEKRYLDFSEYIIQNGGAEGNDLFTMALKNKVMPYQYGVTKAYEMISCFEGIVEYYEITKNERYRKMAVNFGKAIAKTDVSILGCCGSHEEVLDHSSWRQTAHYDGVMQETCVAVTWMKFCARLLQMTGDVTFAEYMERTYWNAYLGSVNTDKIYPREMSIWAPFVKPSLLPFDSYAPLLAGKRGRKVAGGQIFSDGTYFGCCAAIGGAGIGVYLQNAVLCDEEGITVNFFESGERTFVTPNGTRTVKITTDYPASGKVAVKLSGSDSTPFCFRCRIPKWAKTYQTKADAGEVTEQDGYAILENAKIGNRFELDLNLDIRVVKPEKWEEDTVFIDYQKPGYTVKPSVVHSLPEDFQHIALLRGPLVLAADSRLGKDADTYFDVNRKSLQLAKSEDVERIKSKGIFPLVVCQGIDRKSGEFLLIDYASAGKDWFSQIAAWLKTPEKKK